MSKLVALLALYAAVIATMIWLKPPTGGDSDAGETLSVEERDEKILRELMTEGRRMLRDEVKETLKNVDWHISRLEALRKSMDEGLAKTQAAAEGVATSGYDKFEQMAAQVNKLTALTDRLQGVQEKLTAFEERIDKLEKRPAQIIREVSNGGGSPGPAAVKEPDVPALPPPEEKDPAVVAAETAKAKQDLQSDDLGVLFPALEKIREHNVVDAMPRLLELLGTYPDALGRTQAAMVLGEMKLCDAVPALAEALVDKSDLVAQQANKSLRKITGYDTQIAMSARIRARRSARNKFKEWWRSHEEEVRQRLGQPKPADPPK